MNSHVSSVNRQSPTLHGVLKAPDNNYLHGSKTCAVLIVQVTADSSSSPIRSHMAPVPEVTFQPHQRNQTADEAVHASGSMWDHEFAAPHTYAGAYASKATGQWNHTHPAPAQPGAVERPPAIAQRQQAPLPQGMHQPSPSVPSQAHAFPGERLWSMQTPAAVAANAAVAAAAEAAAAAAFPGTGEIRSWPGQHASPPSAGAIHGHRGSPIVEAKEKELKDETDKMRLEREHVAAIRANLQQAQQALDQERLAFEAHKVSRPGTLNSWLCFDVFLSLPLHACMSLSIAMLHPLRHTDLIRQ